MRMNYKNVHCGNRLLWISKVSIYWIYQWYKIYIHYKILVSEEQQQLHKERTRRTWWRNTLNAHMWVNYGISIIKTMILAIPRCRLMCSFHFIFRFGVITLHVYLFLCITLPWILGEQHSNQNLVCGMSPIYLYRLLQKKYLVKCKKVPIEQFLVRLW